MGNINSDNRTPTVESKYVSVDGVLAQFIQAEARRNSSEPNTAYWEENWKGVTDSNLRHALRPTKRLATHGSFFRRNLAVSARILEAGCGTGFWMRRLQENGYRVTGLDYAISSLRRSKSMVPSLEMAAGDLLRLPYQEGTFDAYMSFGVIEHFFDGPRAILEEAIRVLKPGGVILVSTPFRNARRKVVPTVERSDAESLGLQFHQYFFTLGELQFHLAEAGFVVLPDSQAYSVWNGLCERRPILRKLISRIPGMSRLTHFADYLPVLPGRAAHMIFAVGRKPP